MTSILFGLKADWANRILSGIDRSAFTATFHDIYGAETGTFDAVVPLKLSDHEYLRSVHLNGRANFFVPRRRAEDIADDKLRFNTWLRARGYGRFVPELYEGRPEYPFIYKKRYDGFGENSRIIFSRADMEAFEESIEPSAYFRQRYVPGRSEFTAHFLASNGRIKFAGAFEFGFDHDHFVKGKHFAPASKRIVAARHLDLFGDILRRLDFSGTCCFNYKEDDAGRPMIFEMNPRFGASLCYMINSYLVAYLAALEETDIHALAA